jgi:uncharacterized repeat protein (TIGR03806 family)
MLFAAALLLLLGFIPLMAQPVRQPNSSVDIISTGAGLETMRLEPVFTDIVFSSSVYLTHAGDGSGRLFVVERNGVVRVFSPGESQAANFLDIRDRVRSVPLEAGLFCLAFHPDYSINGRLYLFYTHSDRDSDQLLLRLSEFSVSDQNPDRALASTERILLSVPQPAPSHNGGQIAFGPDRMLYVSLGDGKDPNDPFQNGQDPTTILGAILRLDVDGRDPGLEYAVPPDNPFAGTEDGRRSEIWAWGLRNPWRFSFDRLSGELWAGDVGQNTWEEIDLIKKGGNYGWSHMEGFHCFPSDADCDPTRYQLPIFEYDRSQGSSITGGYVYRGHRLPQVHGWYIYGDFASRRVWALRRRPDAPPEHQVLATCPSALVSFGEDEDGEVYAVGFDGKIYRLAAKDPEAGSDTVPLTISLSGIFSEVKAQVPSAGLLPYRVKAPLWSDGAAKTRLLALPDTAQITIDSTGAFVFPPRTVLVKNFLLDQRPVETRLWIKRPEGPEWDGYSYIWNDQGTDAVLLAGDTTVVYNVAGKDQAHSYPSRSQCNACHTPQAGYVLGFRPEQLGDAVLADLAASGYIAGDIKPALDRPTLPAPADKTQSVSHRARAYLDANCANCHLPGGSGRTEMDLRFTTPLEDTGLLAAPLLADLGIDNARRLSEGNPEASVLFRRMATLDGKRMPPLGTALVDTFGIQLMHQWISGLQATAVEETHVNFPTTLTLHPNHPNPFNATTTIRFILHRNSQVVLNVYNLQGQKIKTLLSRALSSGRHSASWNGRDQENRPAASGVYLVRLETAAAVRTNKILLLR